MNIRMVALALLASFGAASAANAAVVIDKSALPINSAINNFGPNGGVQFLNPTTFILNTVQILLGGDTDGTTFDFQVVEFDGALGDTTGAVIGTVTGIITEGLNFDDFATKSVTIDASSLNLTLTAGVVYAFVFNGPGLNVRGGSSGNADTDATVGTVFNGDGAGNFASFPTFEVPFIATSLDAPAVPLPAALPLFIAGLAGIGAIGRRRKNAA